MKGTVLALFIIMNTRLIEPGNRGEGNSDRSPSFPASPPSSLVRGSTVRHMQEEDPDSSDEEVRDSQSIEEEQPGMAPVDLDIHERNAMPRKSLWERLKEMCSCTGRRR
jgi:hypothetical protein